MKKLVILLAFVSLPAFADGSTTVLLSAVTTPTASSSVHSAASPAETGYENWFLFASGPAVAEASFDSGTSWQTVHVFAASSVYVVPVCGGCWLRVRATNASPSSPVSAGVTVSGAVVPVVVAP